MPRDDYMQKYLESKFGELHRRLDDIEVIAEAGVHAKQEISVLKSQVKFVWAIFLSIPAIAGAFAFFGLYINPAQNVESHMR